MTETMTQNPLMAKVRVLDGITIRLPSRGLLYDEGVLADGVTDGEIRIFPMTTRDEILLRSADGLFGGTTIDQVFKRCVPQVTNPRQLFFNDLDYILVALRQASYGDSMTIEYRHDCEGGKDHSYIVRVDTLLRKSKEIDPLTVDDKFTVLLPTAQEVKLRPIRLEAMMQILQPPSQVELSPEQAEDEMLKMYIAQIHSVDGFTDRGFLYEWMSELPVNCIKLIRDKIAEAGDWGVSYTQHITCQDCKQEVEVSTPINPVTFFS